jgi:proline dehydrogenase
VTSVDEANAFADTYREALELFARDGLDANISVKPTALGLKLDRGLCRELAESLVREAAGRGTFVRLDMEDASCTDETLGLYRSLREAGHDNVGVVLQAYLRRTLADIAELAELTPNVRLCKGIYVEPPAIAFHDANVIRRSFVSALEALLRAGCFVGVATHDEPLIRESLALLEGAQPGAYELQMLLGVRKQRAAELVAAGHGLRVYVPFGEQWYEYSLRRLQENPRVAGYVAADLARRLVPGGR